MEKLLANTLHNVNVRSVLSIFFSSFTSLINLIHGKPKTCKSNTSKRSEEHILSNQEIKMVMKRIGIVYEPDGDKLQERYDASEVSKLFEDQEPSLEELRKAFDIFDVNKDGFMDAIELQRVLSCLGLEEGNKVEKCRGMIMAIKEDEDAKIDFNEFLGFMEKCFC